MFVLKGYGLSTKNLDDNYDFLKELDVYPIYSDTGDGDTNVISNVKVCIYKFPPTFEEAQGAIINKYYGEMYVDVYEYWYSEYIVEDFNLVECMIGNHNLDDLLYDKQDRYTILTIERLKNNC